MSRTEIDNPTNQRPVRWARWLAAGAIAGFLFGFVAGLSGPREPLSVDPVSDRVRSEGTS